MNLRRIAIGFLALFLLLPVGAQSEGGKHPRVAEVEDWMAKDTASYIRSRFPDTPFLVTVSVDPLRRNERASSEESGSRLPYFDLSRDEIQDEWDDPQASLGELRLRVRKTVVTISLPDSIRETEINEVKESTFALLHMIPARDEVRVVRKPWKIGAPTWPYLAVGFVGIAVFLGGLFFIFRRTLNRLISALAQQSSKNSTPLPAASMGAGSHTERDKKDAPSGDIKFNDPIKIRELVKSGIDLLSKSALFPTLQDMILLDRMGRKKPKTLGALLNEFTPAVQKKLFSLSFHPCWLEALNDPGELDSDCFNLLQRLLRAQTDVDKDSGPWQQYLITVWRMGEDRAKFLREVTQDEAFATLASLPKNISVPTARKAFPGSWGMVLDPKFRGKGQIKSDQITKLTAKALESCPLNDIGILEKYKHDQEVLEYLKTADVTEEREIYQAAPADSLIHRLRAPFYKILELDDGILGEVVARIPLDDWAMALFNVARNERKAIEAKFTEKQHFMFLEKMKRLDAQTPEKTTVGLAREHVARFTQDYLKTREAEKAVEATSSPEENHESEEKLAA